MMPQRMDAWTGGKIPYLYYKYLRGVRLDKPPVFIVGCGHSGTSLLHAILDSHSRIFAIPPETRVGFRKDPAVWFRKFDFAAVSAGKHRWVEKTPKHIHRIEYLLTLQPEARFLLLLRDGRDVACSLQDRTRDLEAGIARWVTDNREGERFWDHPRVHLVRYESLILEFETTIARILDFLREKYEDGLKEYYRKRRFFYSHEIKQPSGRSRDDHHQYRNWQINQPIFDGRGKWARMTAEEKDLFKTMAGEMLERYGYARGMDW
jgi:hypothetical protein